MDIYMGFSYRPANTREYESATRTCDKESLYSRVPGGLF